MPKKLFRVGRSKTGLGLFAAAPIRKGTLIVAYRGRRIPTRDALERERRYGSRYMFEINSRWTIDGSSRRNLARYINHACRPNAEVVLRKGQLVFRALRDIPAADEITYDYGDEYFDLFIAPVGCKCASCAAKAKRRTRQASSSR